MSNLVFVIWQCLMIQYKSIMEANSKPISKVYPFNLNQNVDASAVSCLPSYVQLLQYRGIIAGHMFLASDIPNSTQCVGVYWPEADDLPSGGWVKDV